ncbi:hypothetical protein K438DRAFT_1854430 [Mycena galopus ATCC 62051]|nr:hypothetical protein K438DRAFT_1854430 [Mycena galopus ATCC 62051]
MITGLVLECNKLHSVCSPVRVRLPVYPGGKDRCFALGSAPTPKSLVDGASIVTLFESRWQSVFWILENTRINNQLRGCGVA